MWALCLHPVPLPVSPLAGFSPSGPLHAQVVKSMLAPCRTVASGGWSPHLLGGAQQPSSPRPSILTQAGLMVKTVTQGTGKASPAESRTALPRGPGRGTESCGRVCPRGWAQAEGAGLCVLRRETSSAHSRMLLKAVPQALTSAGSPRRCGAEGTLPRERGAGKRPLGLPGREQRLTLPSPRQAVPTDSSGESKASSPGPSCLCCCSLGTRPTPVWPRLPLPQAVLTRN